MDIQPYGAMPGTGTLQASQEAQVWVGRDSSQEFGSIALAAATTDIGNTGTTNLLRPGLVLGKITATGLYRDYGATNTDGSEIALAVLYVGTNMLDSSGNTKITQGFIVAKGILQPDFLIGLDGQARRQMVQSGKFIFSDNIRGSFAFLGAPMSERTIAATNATLANVTLLAFSTDVLPGDNGKLIMTTGSNTDVNITLPAVTSVGFMVEVLNTANVNLKVLSAEGANIVFDGVASCNSIAFATTNHKIGGRAQFMVNSAGTGWTVRVMSLNTITIA